MTAPPGRRIAEERDEYARRLVLARAELEELRGQVDVTSPPGASASGRLDRSR